METCGRFLWLVVMETGGRLPWLVVMETSGPYPVFVAMVISGLYLWLVAMDIGPVALAQGRGRSLQPSMSHGPVHCGWCCLHIEGSLYLLLVFYLILSLFNKMHCIIIRFLFYCTTFYTNPINTTSTVCVY